MDVFEQLQLAGIQVVTGHRRLLASLEDGLQVIAVDAHGNSFQIEAVAGSVKVVPVEPSFALEASIHVISTLSRRAPATVIDAAPTTVKEVMDLMAKRELKLRKVRFLPRQALKRSRRAAARKFIINPFDSSALDVGSKLETASPQRHPEKERA
nr:hypothetical protein [Pseudomonas aeruginosa]